jgi:hypothetical protein
MEREAEVANHAANVKAAEASCEASEYRSPNAALETMTKGASRATAALFRPSMILAPHKTVLLLGSWDNRKSFIYSPLLDIDGTGGVVPLVVPLLECELPARGEGMVPVY